MFGLRFANLRYTNGKNLAAWIRVRKTHLDWSMLGIWKATSQTRGDTNGAYEMKELAKGLTSAVEDGMQEAGLRELGIANGKLAMLAVNFDDERFELAVNTVRAIRLLCAGFEKDGGG